MLSKTYLSIYAFSVEVGICPLTSKLTVKRGFKKSSKKSKDNNNTVDLLISTDLQINRNENDYNELISPDQESTTTLNGNAGANNHEKEASSNINEKMVFRF